MFSASYLLGLSIGLFLSFDHLKRARLWNTLTLACAVGYLSGFSSYFVAALFMPDGIIRILNSFHMMGGMSVVIVFWMPIAMFCWLWSVVGFSIVWVLVNLDP